MNSAARARASGAVNTIVNREGRLFGFNTDGPGFVAALKNEAAFDPAGKAILLLGAGGAARGIAFALGEAPRRRIGIWNRTPERASRLADGCRGDGRQRPRCADARRGRVRLRRELHVGRNGGHRDGGRVAVRLRRVPAQAPSRSTSSTSRKRRRSSTAGEAQGCRTLGGLPMLIYQGALAFELWTGVRAPVDVMFEAARASGFGSSAR